MDGLLWYGVGMENKTPKGLSDAEQNNLVLYRLKRLDDLFDGSSKSIESLANQTSAEHDAINLRLDGLFDLIGQNNSLLSELRANRSTSTPAFKIGKLEVNNPLMLALFAFVVWTGLTFVNRWLDIDLSDLKLVVDLLKGL